jgi:hypothetical protein
VASGSGGFPDFGAHGSELSGHAHQHRLCSRKEPTISNKLRAADFLHSPPRVGFGLQIASIYHLQVAPSGTKLSLESEAPARRCRQRAASDTLQTLTFFYILRGLVSSAQAVVFTDAADAVVSGCSSVIASRDPVAE